MKPRLLAAIVCIVVYSYWIVAEAREKPMFIPLSQGCLRHMEIKSWGQCHIPSSFDPTGKVIQHMDRLECKDVKVELTIACTSVSEPPAGDQAKIIVHYPGTVKVSD